MESWARLERPELAEPWMTKLEKPPAAPQWSFPVAGSKPDAAWVGACNALIAAFREAGQPKKCDYWMRRMGRAKVRPSSASARGVVGAWARGKRPEKAEDWLAVLEVKARPSALRRDPPQYTQQRRFTASHLS